MPENENDEGKKWPLQGKYINYFPAMEMITTTYSSASTYPYPIMSSGTMIFNEVPRNPETCSHQFSADSDEAAQRDINHIFKFKVGDKVKKSWRWNKHKVSRFSYVAIGVIGTVNEVFPESGVICMTFSVGVMHMTVHVGASELEVLESKVGEEE